MDSGDDGGDDSELIWSRACVRSNTGDVWSGVDMAGVPKAWPDHGGDHDGGGELRRSWRGQPRCTEEGRDGWPPERNSP